MAFPVILVDSASGSDTQASGAGPSTALFGTTDASTDGAGTVVTLTAGTDLSGVATDGSHVIFLNDSTAGNRNFGKITNTAGSGGATPTVTVSNAFGAGLSGKSWAIGGKRASIGSTTSMKLLDNNGAAGDAMPGWIIQLASAHSETLSATLAFRRDGDTSNGGIILQGDPSAGTLPLLTFSNNGVAILLFASRVGVAYLELRNSNATKTASYGIRNDVYYNCVRGVKISHATNYFYRGLYNNGFIWAVQDCTVGYTADYGIFDVSGSTGGIYNNCYVHHAGSVGIYMLANAGQVMNSVVYANTGDGIKNESTATSSSAVFIASNTVDSNGGDGLELTNNQGLTDAMICNNILSNNGGYGINLSSGGATDLVVRGMPGQIRNNNFYNNTSGKYNPSAINSEDELTLDPQFTNAAAGDFSIGTNLKAKGFPLAGSLYVGKYSTTYSYVDIGAAQRQEAGGGGFVGIIGG